MGLDHLSHHVPLRVPLQFSHSQIILFYKFSPLFHYGCEWKGHKKKMELHWGMNDLGWGDAHFRNLSRGNRLRANGRWRWERGARRFDNTRWCRTEGIYVIGGLSLSLWRQRHRSAHAAFVPSSPQLMLLALAVVAPTARHRIVISVATLSKLLDQLDIFPTYRCPKWIFFQQLIFTGRWESVQQKIYNTLKEQFYPAASLFSLFRSVWRESWGHLVGVCVTNVCKQSTCRATADLAIGPHKCANIDPAKMRR